VVVEVVMDSGALAAVAMVVAEGTNKDQLRSHWLMSRVNVSSALR
jgi:hypothetical protein